MVIVFAVASLLVAFATAEVGLVTFSVCTCTNLYANFSVIRRLAIQSAIWWLTDMERVCVLVKTPSVCALGNSF